jgi:hypothetical protein
MSAGVLTKKDRPPQASRPWRARLFAPVDLTPLAYFRIAFGGIMLWEVWRYFTNGWIDRYYIAPLFHFTYYGFDWVRPWPGDYMYLHFVVLGALALCIAAGLWYRVAMPLFFCGFTYVFLLDMTQYLNHFYLICLVSFLMIWVPAHRMLSLDAYWRPRLRAVTAPAWTLWMLRLQFGLAYFYGGIAKLNGDWLRGEPIRAWLAEATAFPVIGRWFSEEWMVYTFAYGGLLLDLLIVPFLIWKRTYVWACIAALLFHLINSELFSIGIFPWFMIAATLVLYYPYRWPQPRKIWRPAGKRPAETPDAALNAAQRAMLSALGVYTAIQILMPLRHLIYPGNVSWTEEGHNFSWHMKLRDKEAKARFHVKDPKSGETWEVDPGDYLTRRQLGKMAARPDMILQFAHFLAGEYRKKGYENVGVYAETYASLNGRAYQRLIDPKADLAAQPRSLGRASWIVPLTQPLPGPGEKTAAKPGDGDGDE